MININLFSSTPNLKVIEVMCYGLLSSAGFDDAVFLVDIG